MNDGILIFAGLVAHAWIAKVVGPPKLINTVALCSALLLTVYVLAILALGLVR